MNSMLPLQYIYIYTENGASENSNSCLFAANEKWKFVLLGRQKIKGNQCLLCQQLCTSMVVLSA